MEEEIVSTSSKIILKHAKCHFFKKITQSETNIFEVENKNIEVNINYKIS